MREGVDHFGDLPIEKLRHVNRDDWHQD
jgi:hypothetical protein